MKTFTQLFLANWREFARDRMALFFTFAFPLIFIVLFGLLFGGNDSIEATVGIALNDQGPIGEQFVAQLEAVTSQPPAENSTENPYNGLEFVRGTQAELEQQLRAGDITALLVVPAGLSTAVQAQQTAPPLELQVDQSSQVTSPVLQGLIGGLLDSFDRQLTQTQPVLQMQVKPVLSDSLRGIDFLLPGILAMSIMQLGLFATAQPLIAMRTQGILKRLGATPLSRTALLLAYIALRIVIAFLQTVIIIAVGVWLFDVSIVGNWLQVFGYILLGTAMFIAIGFFIAAISRTEESGNAITNMINFPMLFLSGVFFPVDGLPDYLLLIVNAIPLTYTVDALRQAMIDAPPTYSATTNIAVQAAWFAVMSLLAVRFFKWDTR